MRPLLIIYHSREALSARLAALLHVGALERHPDPGRAWQAVQAEQAQQAVGLWPLGPDQHGHTVCAVGRASRPDVVDRIIHGLADVFGIEPTSYLLINAGPGHAWVDLLAHLLRRMGLEALARGVERRLLAARWPGCLGAVERARFRIAERERCR